ncbi:1706_t:CDS:2 [Entrophospora sp. SA101]|nr:1706_t:CDS:2 [Entrophospora sp. SA101]
MSFHVYQILEFGPLQPNEQVFENFTDSRTGAPSTTEDLNTIHQTSSNEITAQHPTHPTPSGEIVPHPIISWEPSQKFIRLLYPEKAKWTQKIENFEYPLIQANLNLRLIENPNPPENRIAVCSSCKKNPRRNFPPYLHPIPVEIQQIPLFKRKYLSLIYLHSSLGWTSNLGAYSEYWSIVGTFGSLIAGANWLADNNPYLREYKNALVTNSSGSVSSSPTATHLPDDETAPEFQTRPNGEPFDNITYKDYIEQYDIKLSAINSSSQTIYRDNLGNYVVKRKTNILTRYRNLWLEHGELYFNQNLLLRVPARSEGDLIGTYETYRDHYLVRFPEEFGNSIKSDQQNQHHQTINMLDQYTNLIENLLYSLQSLLTQDIKGIIRSQLENIKILPPIVPNNSMLSLPSCQYNCVQTIFNYMGPRDTYHYPYFFISGSAGSGKSFLINLFAKKFLELNKNFLLMAPTGVAAVNIQGQTIHSALRIWSHGGRYQTLAFADQEFNQELRKIDTIIIDEVSMVQASLLTFISEMFSGIHQIFAPFGGINVILIGDLAQLPPINGHPVYKSPIWKVFYPIFLCHSHRQQNDPFFYNVLQKIRLGNITPSVWQFLQEKANQNLSLEMSSFHTSYIVGFRKSASYINEIICNHLPALNNKFMISEAIDCVDGRMGAASSSTVKIENAKANRPKRTIKSPNKEPTQITQPSISF